MARKYKKQRASNYSQREKDAFKKGMYMGWNKHKKMVRKIKNGEFVPGKGKKENNSVNEKTSAFESNKKFNKKVAKMNFRTNRQIRQAMKEISEKGIKTNDLEEAVIILPAPK